MEQSSSDSDSSEGNNWDLNLEPIDNNEEDFHEEIFENPIDDTLPKVGMIFQTHEQYYDFYNQYAREKGFSIRRGHAKKLSTGELRKRVLVCSKEGFRQKHSRGTPEKARPKTRTGCMARIQCNFEGGSWIVKKFNEEHNHELASASEAHLLRSQRNILPEQAAYLDSLRAGGCGPSQAHAILSAEHGGSQNLNLTQKDCNNYYYRRQKEIYKEGDAQVAMNYFRRMVRENPGFVYAIQVDKNNQTSNLFWADAKSRIDYNFFGDVVCFDTTFRTNKYGMPCAPLVGVNHHGMSVLFGCALIIDEKTDSFVWVFESFLNAMSGKFPKTILTDQAQAITNAIEQVMPHTHHRLCLWHIYQNAAKHLSHVYAQNKLFKKDFKKCIYKSETEEEFQLQWELMLQKYSLSANQWLQDLYNIRKKWAPVYGREHFCAGMTTTQRSESVNSFVKGYVNSTLCINDFITQYEKAVIDRREKENQAGHNSKQTEPNFISILPFEKQAAKVYTRKIFTIFQKFSLKTISCYFEHLEEEKDYIFNYKVDMVVPVKHDKDRHVRFNTKENTVECSCKAFEFTGILCGHALKVLHSRRIFEIPSQYILKRWTKQAKDDFFIDDSGILIQADCHKSSNLRYSDLVHRAITVAMKGAIDEGSSRVVKHHLVACLEELNSYQKQTKPDEDEGIGRKGQENIELCKIDSHVTLKDPPTKKKKIGQKGTKKESRIKSALEKPSTKVTVQKVSIKRNLPRGTQGLSGLQDQIMTPNQIVNPAINEETQWFRRQSFDNLLEGGLRYPNEEEVILSEENVLPSISTMNNVVPSNLGNADFTKDTSKLGSSFNVMPTHGVNHSSKETSFDGLLPDNINVKQKTYGVISYKQWEEALPERFPERLQEINPDIRDFIENWEEVKGDGHCGFRAIAEQLGFSIEDGWKKVRKAMLNELKTYADEYTRYLGGTEELFKECEIALQCEKEPAPRSAWIKFPAMGPIVASAFRCVFVVVDPRKCVTYLPLREPPDSSKNAIVIICNVDNGTHYVKLQFMDDAPLPQIDVCWKTNKYPIATSWAEMYKHKFDNWDDRVPRTFTKRNRAINFLDFD